MNQLNEKRSIPSGETSPLNPTTAMSFDRLRQARSLLMKFLGRWLLTAAICAAFAVVLKEYDRRPWMEDGSAHIYNAVVSGLTICLSLNIDASLNAFAAAFKWAIASSKQFSPRIFEFILAFDNSKVNAIKLIFWRGVGAWWLRLICVLWLFVALAAQVGTALIGLTYSVIPLSPDRGKFPTPRGDGRTSIFTQIGYAGELASSDQESNLTTQRSNAFDYGVGGINSGWDYLDDPSPFMFHTSTFDNDTGAYVNAIPNYPNWASNSLTAWNVIERWVNNFAYCDNLTITGMNTSSDTTEVAFDGYNGTQIFSISQTPLDYITYISDTSFSCGLRCTQVYALYSADETTKLFVCNNTVSHIYDNNGDSINRTDLLMPDTQARILAGAIGWGDLDVDSSLDALSMPNRFQASSFPNGSYWAPHWTASEDIDLGYVPLFTASAIVTMTQYGIQKNFTDILIPGTASQLDVTWKYSVLILALIPSIQALLALLCVLVVYVCGVSIHDGSLLAITTLLSPALSHIATSDLRSGKEIAKTLGYDLQYTHERGEGDREGKWAIEMIGRKIRELPDGACHQETLHR
ncbi:uncharacterized protein F4807DRAFT_448962 [Annulohypoxylon truncatum]|uniref:uncharacterized protein n=1 Tax=Annulohypoxylon truncatum TaxID=327061 RepID=UPI00200830A2|nr:uncharacterized protein F4807DRAFT_448962 [Annulohypoxylon truncatum]KAI1204108.1 hypothetical protein F4807DRAFT_448962 [Annulohypoxylon truncatum]